MSTTVTYKGSVIATLQNETKALETEGKYCEANIFLTDNSQGGSGVAQAIPFGIVDGTSTSTAFTATIPEITSLQDGTCMLLKNGVVTSAAGFTININGLGAKPVYSNMAAASAETTIFNVAYTMLFIFDETRVAGGAWICYRGYDSNTNTIGYQLRTNSTLRVAADKGYRYRLWFQTLDGKFAPANTSSSTNATASRTPNTRVIDPFGEIIYYSTNGTTNADANLTATACWQQYTLSLGYSFNTTGAALTLTNPAPVYVKCTPQSGGGVKMDGYVQTLPTTEDGKCYIYLGMAYSATSIELVPYHPVYEYKNGAIRLYTNAVQELPAVSGSDNGKVLRVVSGVWSADDFPEEVFVAVYGTTTASEIGTAYQAGKICICKKNSTYALLSENLPPNFYFTCVDRDKKLHTMHCSSTGWEETETTLVDTASTSLLPAVTGSDNGKVLRVVSGAWAAVQLPSASGVSF